MASNSDDPLRAVIANVVAASGVDLEDMRIRSHGNERAITVIVDADEGVTLDAAAAMSREISAALDELSPAPFRGGAFTLEVTSRGVSAPLQLPRHYQRALGRLVRFQFSQEPDSVGRIAYVTAGSVTVLTGKKETEIRTIALDTVTKATVEIEFSAPSRAIRERLTQVAQQCASDKGDQK